MDFKTFGLGFIAVVVLAIAGFLYFSQQNHNAKTNTSVSTASPTVRATPVESVTPSTITATPTSSNRVFTESQALAQPNIIETIPTGGSLFQIAQEHSLNISELAKLNNISDVNKVYAGQTILVPDSADNGTFILLYITNTVRQKKEEQKLSTGATSIYSDPIMAAQADTKGVYGLVADTPYSKANETATSVTLSSADDQKIVTILMEKLPTELWVMKRLTIKRLQKETE